MWQELREELFPQGVEVVTVALDAGGAEAAGSFIDYAKPQHPSLIDAAHQLDALGIVNVPSGVWVDEDGVLVRPAEIAHPGKSMLRELLREHGVPKDAPQLMLDQLAATRHIQVKPERYAEALRDWAAHGAESKYVLAPEEVVERSRPMPREHSEAAAHFELGVALRDRDVEASREHFRAAHRLDPDNWTYKRQAWFFEDPLQGPTEHYESDWLSEVSARGPESYYPLPDL